MKNDKYPKTELKILVWTFSSAYWLDSELTSKLLNFSKICVVKEISERTQNPSVGIIFDAKRNVQKRIFENFQYFQNKSESSR